jgi:tetratricopeptide (TPR) repeat protein
MAVPRLFFTLLRQRFTGTLTLEQGDPAPGRRSVWFRGGMPVFTDWFSEPDLLGSLLLEQGLIDTAMLERGLQGVAAGQGRLGSVLLALGAIDTATRSELLRSQCTRKLTLLFALRQGEVIVSAGEHELGSGDELLQVNMLALIFRGVTAHYDRERIVTELDVAESGDLVATPALARYQRQFGFAEHDAVVLAMLARGATFAGLRGPGIDELRALRIIYTLWICQMLRTGQDAAHAIAKGSTAAAVGEAKPEAASKLEPSRPSESSKAAGSRSLEPRKPEAASKPAEPRKPEAASKPEPSKSALADDFEPRLASLEAKIADEANAFMLFDLPLEAERKQIREHWAELSKTFHPDALEAAGRGHLRERVERVFASLSEAYGVLSDKDQRAKLREAIEAGGSIKAGEDATAVVRNVFEAELLARDADKLLRGNLWERARDLYARAHQLSPNDGDIEAALHYATHQAGPRQLADTRQILTQLGMIIQVAPNCARAHYFAGLLHVQIDESDAAKLRFIEALRLDPRNVDAERQLRVLKLRERGPGAEAQPKKDDKKGFGLRGLFGKK